MTITVEGWRGQLGRDGRAAWRVALACGVCALLILAGSVIALAFGLVFASDARIEANLRTAGARGVLLGRLFYPDWGHPSSPYGHSYHAYDMYTECIALGVNLSNAEDGLLRRMAASPSLNRKTDTCRNLLEALATGNLRADQGYWRFWHGYQVYLRPMLSVMSLHTLRRVIAVLFYGVLIYFAFQVAAWFGPLAWPVTLLPFFIVGDFLTVPIVTSHAASLAVIFLSVALVPWIVRRFPDARSLVLPVYVFSAGMVTNFISFLLNPPLAPVLIGFLAIAHGVSEGRRPMWREVLYASGLMALWFAGYFVEWFGKWVFAAVVLGADVVVADVLGRVREYSDEKATAGLGILGPTWLNLAPSRVALAWVAASFAGALASIGYGVLRRRISAQGAVAFLMMLLPLLAIVVWVETNGGHSMIHVGFVSRSFLLFSIVPLLAAILIWRRATPDAAVRPL